MICVDLYCGLGGWAEGFLSEGYEVVGFDIEHHDYGTGIYPGQFVMQDVTTLIGAQFKKATCIVASPPCQAYSYRAMPWSRAKALPPPDNTLFETCFRIQREAIEAAGHHVPMIIENVCGAQKWVGRAGWHFGSYYLWGDIPALMPITQRGHKVSGFRFDGSGGSFQTASVKATGQDWNRFKETGEVSPHWRMEAGRKGVPHRTSGHWTNPDDNGIKQSGIGGTRKNGKGDGWFQDGAAQHFSKSRARASAEIAKIPFPLAQHIARCFRER